MRRLGFMLSLSVAIASSLALPGPAVADGPSEVSTGRINCAACGGEGWKENGEIQYLNHRAGCPYAQGADSTTGSPAEELGKAIGKLLAVALFTPANPGLEGRVQQLSANVGEARSGVQIWGEGIRKSPDQRAPDPGVARGEAQKAVNGLAPPPQAEDPARARIVDLVKQGRYDEAGAELKKLLERDPHDATLKQALGKVLNAMLAMKDAMKEMRDAEQAALGFMSSLDHPSVAPKVPSGGALLGAKLHSQEASGIPGIPPPETHEEASFKAGVVFDGTKRLERIEKWELKLKTDPEWATPWIKWKNDPRMAKHLQDLEAANKRLAAIAEDLKELSKIEVKPDTLEKTAKLMNEATQLQNRRRLILRIGPGAPSDASAEKPAGSAPK